MSKVKIPIQKGRIEANQPTMKHKPFIQSTFEDLEQNSQRIDGQTLKLHIPK